MEPSERAVDVEELAAVCLRLIDRDGIDFMRPVACVPSTKQLIFMIDGRGMVDRDEVRAWALSVSKTGADFLVAYQSGANKFTIDAFVGTMVTSTTFDAPDG